MLTPRQGPGPDGGAAQDARDGLAHHGDRDAAPGAINFAVNVLDEPHRAWLLEAVRTADIVSYPDAGPAAAAIAARHGRPEAQVLATNGAAEAFVLIARALSARHAVVIHPQFTEPELALRQAGVPVERVILAWPFVLDSCAVPESADLVFLGNPTNPTSVLHTRASIDELRRPGRLIVLDEAFADCVPGEPESFAHDVGAEDVIVIRSLTKLWGLAGLRIGYVLAAEPIIARLRTAQPLWSVNAPALAVCIACCEPRGLAEGRARAALLDARRDALHRRLDGAPDLQVVPGSRAPFVLARSAHADVRDRLMRRGIAVRRGSTFPGLDSRWFRAAARNPDAAHRLASALRALSSEPETTQETSE